MTAGRLQRFKDAQDQPVAGYKEALAEIRAGAKRRHWIWYVFPQLAGLGRSAPSIMYGIDDRAEAEEYLRDPVLRSRLLTIAAAVAECLRSAGNNRLERVMGSSIDAAKLVSSMTLFGRVAADLHASEGLADCASMSRVADEILAVAEAQGLPPCGFTLSRLRH